MNKSRGARVQRIKLKFHLIMKRAFLALAALAIVLPAWQQTRAADVSVDFFYNNLSGGSWIEVADYGYCWQPDVVVSNSSWRPYADGYWAYTDLGWTWVSYEDFGWATYHYGRWARLTDYGWVWVPGRDADLEWGPAWVSWRTGGDYVGWAPLPPGGAVIYEGGAITGHVDVEFDIGPAYYNFVDIRYIGEPVLRERIFAPTQNITYIQQTVNVTNITYKNKVVYNYGPDINVINSHSSRPIQRLKLERQENVDVSAAAKSGALTKVQGDKLVVAAPMTIKKPAQQIAPPTVKTKVTQAKIDKGWSGVSDPNVQTQLKQKMKTEDAKQIPPPTGAAATGQPSGAASPTSAVSPMASAAPATSPAEVGKGKKGRLREQAQPNATGAPAGSPGEAASPAGATSPVATPMGPERGRHPKGGRGELQRASPPTTGGPTVAPETTPPGGGKHKGQLERGNLGQSPAQPGEVSSERGQGKQKGRRLEQGGTPPPAGDQGPQGSAGAGGGKHKGQGETMQPSNVQPGAPAGGERPGKGEGKKKKGEEASPSPSPQ
jgi:hypothetical protein